MTISLCVICGQEAAHIERMLTSFSHAFDELSLVRACGSTTPDDTELLARQWCESHGKTYVFSEYINSEGSRSLPHVDDFAAARNQSFTQASGEWLVWADCDDEIDHPDQIRTALDDCPADTVMLRFPYQVPLAEKHTQRERAIRRTHYQTGRRWHWPVHENILLIGDDKWENRESPSWIHSPLAEKSGGPQRNLRILTHALKEAPTYYYYCHQENYHLGQPAQCRRFGDLFLSLPGGNPAMRYQCHLNLCELAELKDEATTHALKAHHLFPRQKEAVAALVRCAFQEESPERALHWAKQLHGMPTVPLDERIWCYEPKWEGWAAQDLIARAYRYAGHPIEARMIEDALHHHMAPEFSLLHATRGRPEQAVQCREKWLNLAEHPERIEHLFAIDAEDKQSYRWLRSFNHVVSPETNCVAAWNLAAAKSHGHTLIQLSDDWTPPRHWDTALRQVIGQRHPFQHEYVVAVSDGHRKDDLLCMAILSRARYEAQGHLFSPEYTGVFSDNEFTHRAHHDGIVINARHLTFHHHHPAFGEGQMDETYHRQNSPEAYAQGEATFKRRNPMMKQPCAGS